MNEHINNEEIEKSLMFSFIAFDELAKKQQMKNIARYLNDRQDDDSRQLLKDLVYTFKQRRFILFWKTTFATCFFFQLFVVLDDEDCKFIKFNRFKNLEFVFIEQNVQWYVMNRELIAHYFVFRKSLNMTETHLMTLSASWSLYNKFASRFWWMRQWLL